MNELAYCANWGEQLAARHPEDLTQAERSALEQHLRECSVCVTAYTAFHAMEKRIRTLPQAESLPSLLSQLQQLPQEENSNITTGLREQNTLPTYWQEDPLSVAQLSISPVQTYLTVITIKGIDSYSEVIADDSDSLEVLIESLISVILADFFDIVSVREVMVHFTSDSQNEEPEWDIRMTAQGSTCAYSPKQYVSNQQQLEGLSFLVEEKVSCSLLELFSLVIVDEVEIFVKDSEMISIF